MDASTTAWWSRYRDERVPRLNAWNDVVAGLLAHKSVRHFTSAPVDDEVLRTVVAAAQSASSGSNQQAWSVVAVRSRERRERLMELSHGQEFITEAPVYLVWLADLSRVHRLAERHGSPFGAGDHLEALLVAVIDVALAAQNAVVAAESFGLGAVFVGSLRTRPDLVAVELGLPRRAVPVFGMCLGHPDPGDGTGVKPRLDTRGVLHHETYDVRAADEAVTAFEAAYRAYFEEQGRTRSWTRRSLEKWRSQESLNGRQHLRARLADVGWRNE